MPTFYEDPEGIRDVLYAHDPDRSLALDEAAAEQIEKALDHAVGRGAIRTDDRFEWRNRLRREPELVGEVLESLPGDRNFADIAARRDLRLINLRHAWDAYTGIEEEVSVRAFDDARKSDSELLYAKLAEATNEHVLAR